MEPGPYIPTPEAIAAACLEFQAGWTEAERMARARQATTVWLPNDEEAEIGRYAEELARQRVAERAGERRNERRSPVP